MALSPRLQVQSNPPSCAFPVFATNSTSPQRRCTIRQPLNLIVAAPLRLTSSPLFLLSASAYPPPQSLSESLNSDPNTIPKTQGNSNHNDSCNDEKKKTKRRRKPRPSYLDLTLQRWSRPISSDRHSFPWQTHNPLNSSSPFSSSSSQDSLNFSFPNLEDKPQPQLEVDTSSLPLKNLSTSREETEADSHLPSKTGGTGKTSSDRPTTLRDSIRGISSASASATPLFKSRPKPSDDSIANASATPLTDSRPEPSDDSIAKLIVSSVTLPWERDRDSGTDAHDKKQNELRGKSNTELAERTIPELELKRLRDAALRMKERMRVGPAGVTGAIVRAIHDKWKEEEVVKLRFEGPPSLNMKRTHQILEGKTGGIVIWRSGRSLVLYRGMSYEFPCVKSYTTNKSVASGLNLNLNHESSPAPDALDAESLLDGLGPRYKDWSGQGPLPVDADLLPGLIPGYMPPYRLLPYKTRRSLRDAEMTALRRLARSIAPHFALGRNREHQGLAAAIVKLWEKSVIAKIAIKRGLPMTSNERMAEEIKKLTGGTLLSRDKEYIVLYRGNDFVTPSIRSALLDKQRQAVIRQDDEERARQKALNSLSSDNTPVKGRCVAGTLAETTEAASKWGNHHHLISEVEKEEMRLDLAVSKHASLVRLYERKLYFAKVKFAKAEKALAKVHEALIPTELPTDLETVTDEERSKFRSIGLKMKAFLTLGRREVFDGTIQNIHLNWKHNELVKVIVKRKSFAQVKHIAIDLEAESGGVLISLDKTTKGYAIILYRGKNYQRPHILRPKNLLTGKQALARSIELQRREALKYHMFVLQGKIQTMKTQLEQMRTGVEIKEKDLLQESDNFSDDDLDEEGEEAYLQTYASGGEDSEDYNSDYNGDDEIN